MAAHPNSVHWAVTQKGPEQMGMGFLSRSSLKPSFDHQTTHGLELEVAGDLDLEKGLKAIGENQKGKQF